jgi:hypothetical protein
MRVQGRRAVRTHDLQILDPIVITDPIYVVEDHGHAPSAPVLVLSALLALRLLQTLLKQAPL